MQPGRRRSTGARVAAAAAAEARSATALFSTFEAAMLPPSSCEANASPEKHGRVGRVDGGSFGALKPVSALVWPCKPQASPAPASLARQQAEEGQASLRGSLPAVLEAVLRFKHEASACVQKYLDMTESAFPSDLKATARAPSQAVSMGIKEVTSTQSREGYNVVSRERHQLPDEGRLLQHAEEVDHSVCEPGVDDKVDEVTRHLLQARDKIEAVEREFAHIMGELAAYGKQQLPDQPVQTRKHRSPGGDAGDGDASGGASAGNLPGPASDDLETSRRSSTSCQHR
ncbi:unnamed protein product [Symbiodinium natans]|uniref:Uncharacterized protein n=1 Tax=Symbiodinium natans TaxID=878477 RepID=A0A812HT25_9DINO|nr:unnamed protein product [Symbiodinium natans]